MQSIVLLTEGTPFVLFLAIDPRIVVTAIEVNNGEYMRVAKNEPCEWRPRNFFAKR